MPSSPLYPANYASNTVGSTQLVPQKSRFIAQEPKAPTVSSWHLIQSATFLNGCMAGVAVAAQVGVHFLFFCWSIGRSAGQSPSVVMSKASTRRTPNLSRQACANKSSPMGPYLPFLTPTFQLICESALQSSTFSVNVTKAARENTSRFPKYP